MKCVCGHTDEQPYPDGWPQDIIDRDKFIEVGFIEKITDILGVHGHPRIGDGVFHGLTTIYACPECGTLKIKTGNISGNRRHYANP